MHNWKKRKRRKTKSLKAGAREELGAWAVCEKNIFKEILRCFILVYVSPSVCLRNASGRLELL